MYNLKYLIALCNIHILTLKTSLVKSIEPLKEFYKQQKITVILFILVFGDECLPPCAVYCYVL